MENVTAVLTNEAGPEPKDCPFPEMVPDGRRAYIVPRESRALLARIAAARKEANGYKPNQPRYAHLKVVEERAHELDTLLLRHSGAQGIAIEYHADWLYSVLTREDVMREHHEANRAAGKNGAEQSQTSGLCFAYRERPPEVCSLWEYVLKKV